MTTTPENKPRKATIQRWDTHMKWHVMAVNADGSETPFSTNMDAWSADLGNCVFPLGDWAKRYGVQFTGGHEGAETLTMPCTSLYAFNQQQHNEGLRLRQDARSIAGNIKAESGLDKAIAEAVHKSQNAECEDCHKRFCIPGIDDLPEGIELRHTEGHEDSDSYPSIITDVEKIRREQAAEEERAARFGNEMIHFQFGTSGNSIQVTGRRRHVDAIAKAIGTGAIKLD